MALSYRGGCENSAIDGADVVVNLPGGTATNDVVLIGHGSPRSGTTMGMDTGGYTEIVHFDNASNVVVSINRKVMGGTPDSTAQANGSAVSADAHTVVGHVWTGADTTTPEDATGTTASSINNPAIVTVTNGAVVLAWMMSRVNDAAVTAPTNYINQVDITDSDTRSTTMCVASREIASAGSEDPATWTDITSTSPGAVTTAIRPAASGAKTISADSVSWSWTATAVSIEHGREVVPESVAWSWSAQNVGLHKGKTIVPDSVAWSWNAADVSLEHGREIIPDSVAWSWSVTNAGLEHGKEIVPESVAWAWNVDDVTFRHGYEIVPESVAWTWSASDVTFVTAAQKIIVPDDVAWSWSTGDISLEHGWELVPEDVAWNWSVGDATFTIGGVAPVVETPQPSLGRLEPLKFVDLDEWLKEHHPVTKEEVKQVVEAAQEQIDRKEEIVERARRTLEIERAKARNESNERFDRAARRLNAVIDRAQAQIDAYAAFITEMALRGAALERQIRESAERERAYRMNDDEEALITIIHLL